MINYAHQIISELGNLGRLKSWPPVQWDSRIVEVALPISEVAADESAKTSAHPVGSTHLIFYPLLSRWNCCGTIQLRALAFFPHRCHRFRKAAWHSREPRHQFCVHSAQSFTCFTHLESMAQAPPWLRSKTLRLSGIKKCQHSKC